MRSWPVFVAAGVAVAVAVTLLLGNQLAFCASESAPSTYVCPDGGGGCLLVCSLWSPAFLIGPLTGLLVALAAGFLVPRIGRRSAASLNER
jgi:hypothetical protein